MVTLAISDSVEDVYSETPYFSSAESAEAEGYASFNTRRLQATVAKSAALAHLRNGFLDVAHDSFLIAATCGELDSMMFVAASSKHRGDTADSIRWHTKAAEAGVRDAMYNLGNAYQLMGSNGRAVEWYTKAADAGDDDAMVNLASYFIANDQITFALVWCHKAAAAGNAKARELLASVGSTP